MNSARTPALVLVAAVILILALVFLVWRRWEHQPAPTPELTEVEARKLAHQAQLAIGNLENCRFPEADAALNEVIAKLPDELFGLRNLAISRLLAYEDGHLELEPLESALQSLRDVDPDSEVTYWLVGRAEGAAARRVRACVRALGGCAGEARRRSEAL